MFARVVLTGAEESSKAFRVLQGNKLLRHGHVSSLLSRTQYYSDVDTFVQVIPIDSNHLFRRRISSSAISRNYSGGTIKVNEQSLRTKADVNNFLGHLSVEQKALLFRQLNLTHKCEHGECSEVHHYLSKFGRPSAYVEEVPVRWHEGLGETDRGKSSITPTLEASDDQEDDDLKPIPIPRKDIYAVGLKNALPFVGFGFLDNVIMIVAGDYIDLTLGTVLGISTMAAAALGNTISDVAGIASAWYVEHFAEKFGIHTPKLTTFQANSWQIRWSINVGRAIGVALGCFLGMIPLFFFL